MMRRQAQRALCKKYNAPFIDVGCELKIGVSNNVDGSDWPINGLRHLPEGDTSGWYIWAGLNYSDAPDFFSPLHVKHLIQKVPIIEQFLGLAPGWRFIVDPTYEDVWFDENLLRTD